MERSEYLVTVTMDIVISSENSETARDLVLTHLDQGPGFVLYRVSEVKYRE